MESTWYLFPGQTLDNTKISERAHALHLTKECWNDITRHLDRKKLIQEALDKEAAVKKYLDDGSKNMTKEWENSLENVRRRKEEERAQLIEQKLAERQNKFLQLRKDQEEIRMEYMNKVKKQIFMTTGHARDLTSSLVLSEVLYEREKQQEFSNKIKQHEIEEEQRFLDLQNEKAKEAEEKEKKKNELVKERDRKNAVELKKTIEDRVAFEKITKENQVANETKDNIEADKEIKKMEQFKKDQMMQRKKELYEERKKSKRRQEEEAQHQLKEEKELEEVLQIYNEAKHRIDCLKKRNVDEMRKEQIRIRQEMANKVMQVQEDKSREEEECRMRAIREKEEVELEHIKARQLKVKTMKEERLKNIKEVLEKEEQKKIQEKELIKWALLNRYKTDEAMKNYELKKKQECWQQILNYRKELCEQIHENHMDRDFEKMVNDALDKVTNEKEDAKFFEYANELMEFAKKKGRSVVPIERVVQKYIKQNNITSSKLNGQIADTKTKKNEKRQCKCYKK